MIFEYIWIIYLINEFGSWFVYLIILNESSDFLYTLFQTVYRSQSSPYCQKVSTYLLLRLYQNFWRYLFIEVACPMDKIPFEFAKLGIESFHINRTIVKMLKLNLQTTATVEQSKPSPPPLTPKSDNKKGSQKKLAPPKPEAPR